MRLITSSVIKQESTNVDGTITVTEEHFLDNTASSFLHTYIAPSTFNIIEVMNQRAININNDLIRKEQQLLEATNFEIPLSQLDIIKRLTPTEWNKFSSSTIPEVIYFKEAFDKAEFIYRTDSFSIQGFNLLIYVGILTQPRVTEILA